MLEGITTKSILLKLGVELLLNCFHHQKKLNIYQAFLITDDKILSSLLNL